MIAPTRSLTIVVGGSAMLTVLLYAYPEGWPAFIAINSGLITIACFDLISLPQKRDFCRPPRNVGTCRNAR